MNGLALEFFKMRHRRVLWVCVALLSAQILWEGVDLIRSTPMHHSWLGLGYDMVILDAVLFPLAVSVLASRNCEGEHRGGMLKLLETMTTPTRLYWSKLMWGALILACLVVGRFWAFIAIGFMMAFPGPIAWDTLIWYHLGSWMVSVMIYGLQQGLSLRFVNQAVALIVGLVGSFLGLMSAFFPYTVARWIPWGYYGLMATVHVQWDHYKMHQVVPYEAVLPQIVDVGLLVVWMLIFVFVGWRLFVRQEG